MKYTLILLMTCWSATTFSQSVNHASLDLSLLSGDQKMVRMAVDSSLCLVRQEYILVNENGNEYGRNGKEYFGKIYAVGVMAENKIWIDSKILSPWETDANYTKFKQTDSVKPALSKMFARKLIQPSYEEWTQKINWNIPNTSLTTYKSSNALFNIPQMLDSQDPSGWLVLITSKDDINTNDSPHINYTIYKAQPSFINNSGKGYIKNITAAENVIGGVYYTYNISLGKLLFAASGILQKDTKGWFIQNFPSPQTAAKNDNLTPLKKSKGDDKKKSLKKDWDKN